MADRSVSKQYRWWCSLTVIASNYLIVASGLNGHA